MISFTASPPVRAMWGQDIRRLPWTHQRDTDSSHGLSRSPSRLMDAKPRTTAAPVSFQACGLNNSDEFPVSSRESPSGIDVHNMSIFIAKPLEPKCRHQHSLSFISASMSSKSGLCRSKSQLRRLKALFLLFGAAVSFTNCCPIPLINNVSDTIK